MDTRISLDYEGHHQHHQHEFTQIIYQNHYHNYHQINIKNNNGTCRTPHHCIHNHLRKGVRASRYIVKICAYISTTDSLHQSTNLHLSVGNNFIITRDSKFVLWRVTTSSPIFLTSSSGTKLQAFTTQYARSCSVGSLVALVCETIREVRYQKYYKIRKWPLNNFLITLSRFWPSSVITPPIISKSRKTKN